MNDRYLFRAKRKDNGEWIIGSLIQTPYLGSIRSWISSEQEDKARLREISSNQAVWRALEVRTDTICQCSGLKDKNGKRIWENDIIKYHFGNVYAPIKYGEYQSCFDSTSTGHIGFYVDWRGTKKENMRKDLGYWINMISAEVVGNIFDNPELLEVGE